MARQGPKESRRQRGCSAPKQKNQVTRLRVFIPLAPAVAQERASSLILLNNDILIGSFSRLQVMNLMYEPCRFMAIFMHVFCQDFVYLVNAGSLLSQVWCMKCMLHC
uniref:Uncharacterized protein n=1 Tax=Aegilops tauschii subsp. strangulata TaxID=200361 RepID=A0A453EBV6_AEGTS